MAASFACAPYAGGVPARGLARDPGQRIPVTGGPGRPRQTAAMLPFDYIQLGEPTGCRCVGAGRCAVPGTVGNHERDSLPRVAGYWDRFPEKGRREGETGNRGTGAAKGEKKKSPALRHPILNLAISESVGLFNYVFVSREQQEPDSLSPNRSD